MNTLNMKGKCSRKDKRRKPISEETKQKRRTSLLKRKEEKLRLEEEEKKRFLPCPFCGSNEITWCWQIPEWCQCECGVTSTYSGKGKEEAIRLWNKRVNGTYKEKYSGKAKEIQEWLE